MRVIKSYQETAYKDIKRDGSEGQIHIGKSLKLDEKFYPVAWLIWMKIETLTGMPSKRR